MENVKKIKIKCPAKINLTLDIVGLRSDGYHDMKMVMQSIDLCDDLTVSFNNENKINFTCSDNTIPCDDKNIVIKACNKFFEMMKINSIGLNIHLEKNIPHGAGMGGGSADAACMLIALNHLYNTNLSLNELINIGVKIGADVPFCLTGSTALVEGIGEIITPLKPLTDCYFVIIKPNQSINTKNAFLEFDKGNVISNINTNQMIKAISNSDIEMVANNLGNIFEQTVELSCLEKVKDDLKHHGALNAVMTGSGSAIFGVFDKFDIAKTAYEKLLAKGYNIFISKPMEKFSIIFE